MKTRKSTDIRQTVNELLLSTGNYKPNAYSEVNLSDLVKMGLQINPDINDHASDVWAPAERRMAMEQIKEKIQEAIDIANDYNLNKTKKTLTEINNKIGRALLNESQFTRLADTNEQEKSIRKVEQWIKKLGMRLVGGTPMPEVPAPATVILDMTYHGSEIYIYIDGRIEVYGKSADTFEKFSEIVNFEK